MYNVNNDIDEDITDSEPEAYEHLVPDDEWVALVYRSKLSYDSHFLLVNLVSL